MRPKLHIFGLFLAALLCAILLAACYDNAPTATPSGWNGTPPRYEVPTPSVATSITVITSQPPPTNTAVAPTATVPAPTNTIVPTVIAAAAPSPTVAAVPPLPVYAGSVQLQISPEVSQQLVGSTMGAKAVGGTVELRTVQASGAEVYAFYEQALLAQGYKSLPATQASTSPGNKNGRFSGNGQTVVVWVTGPLDAMAITQLKSLIPNIDLKEGVTLITLGSTPDISGQQDAAGAQAYLKAALDIIEEKSIMRDKVDIKALRREAEEAARNANTPAETYPAISNLLRKLGDNHSRFIRPTNTSAGQSASSRRESGIILGQNLVVTAVYEGSPAALAGLRAGDSIEEINGKKENPSAATTYIYGQNKFSLKVSRYGQSEPFVLEITPALVDRYIKPEGRLIGGKIAYLDVPGFAHPDPKKGVTYAQFIQDFLSAADERNACGWIVDLRRNTGGNMYPMVAGVGPLAGEGTLGTFINNNNKRQDWGYRDGGAFATGINTKVAQPRALKNPNAPVAVLIGGQTASAGEATLISFLGRPKTRTFGEPTYGVPTGNASHILSDGAVLVLTEVYEADRTGKVYDSKISPDEFVKTDWRKFSSDDEPVIQAATAWLSTQPGCQN